MTLAVIASGAAMVWYQWRLLRASARVSRAWLPLTVLAWYGGWVVGMELLGASGRLDAPWTPSLGALQHAELGTAVGIAYGVVTSIMLARHARRSPLDAMQRAIADHMYRG